MLPKYKLTDIYHPINYPLPPSPIHFVIKFSALFKQLTTFLNSYLLEISGFYHLNPSHFLFNVISKYFLQAHPFSVRHILDVSSKRSYTFAFYGYDDDENVVRRRRLLSKECSLSCA
jgi:hypothetical protein